jgi:hypothetical protein
VYTSAIAIVFQPKIAISSCTVAPLSAARVAAIFRTPCADLVTPALRAASLKALPNDSFFSDRPFSPQMKARSLSGRR